MNAVTAVVSTSRGLVRQVNEDSVGALGWLAPAETPTPVSLSTRTTDPVVVAVADGLGGHPAGAVASRLAVEQLLAAAPDLVGPPAVEGACRRIHARILQAGAARPERTGMATTLVAAVIAADKVIVCHVGDSRVYYVEPGLVEQLTTDDAEPGGNGALLQVLGGRADARLEPHVTALPLDAAARFLLCSDGLHNCIPRNRLRALAAEADPLAAVTGLAAAARDAGAPDNVSICLLTFDEQAPGPEDRR